MKQNYKIFKSNPVFSISGQLLVLQNLFVFFWSWPRASFWIEPGGLFDLPGGVGGVGVWVNVAGGPLAGGLVVVAPFFCGNRKMGGNLLNRVKRDSNLGLVRLDPLVLWHSNGSTSKLPSARCLFSLSRWNQFQVTVKRRPPKRGRWGNLGLCHFSFRPANFQNF